MRPPNTPSCLKAAKAFESLVQPFLANHCIECHSGEAAKGAFRADTRTKRARAIVQLHTTP